MGNYEGKGIWCVAETRRGEIVPTICELVSAARPVADARGEGVTAVLIGKGVQGKAAGIAKCKGVDRVLTIDNDELEAFREEAFAAALAAAAKAEKPRTILLPASIYGRSLAPRLAVELGSGLAADAISASVDGEKRLVVERGAYAGNVVASVALKSPAGPEMATVKPMAFERCGSAEAAAETASIETDPSSWSVNAEYASFAADESAEIDLGSAEKVVSGGRGLGKAENYQLVKDLAKELGAAVGASRAIVDAGWVPYKHQVGLTGRAVRPKLYIAAGISGQIQHMAGMNASGTIVAINTDDECPMMKVATYAVKGDATQIIPAMIAEIKKVKN